MRIIAVVVCLFVLLPIHPALGDDEKLLQEVELEITSRDLAKEAMDEANERAERIIRKSRIWTRRVAAAKKLKKARAYSWSVYLVKSGCELYEPRNSYGYRNILHDPKKLEECEERVEKKLKEYPRLGKYGKARLENEHRKARRNEDIASIQFDALLDEELSIFKKYRRKLYDRIMKTKLNELKIKMTEKVKREMRRRYELLKVI